MTDNLLNKNFPEKRVDLESLGQNSWRSKSNDPHIIFTTTGEAAQGWIRFDLELEFDGHAAPKLYFDFGTGFEEQTSVLLNLKSKNHYRGLVYTEEAVLRLRIDPIDSAGKFIMTSLKMKPLTKFDLAIFGTGRAATLIAKNPIGNYKRVVDSVKSVLDRKAFRSIAAVPQLEIAEEGVFAEWIKRYDYNPKRHQDGLDGRIQNLTDKPQISIVMPVYNTPAKLLDQTIKAVVNQRYPHWELCICNDNSPDDHVRKQLDKWAKKDSRIKVYHRKENGHISRASNSALTLVTSDWVALLDHDDILRENALAEVAFAINENPNAQLIYSDEDKLDERGVRYDPYFKCEFSPELFKSMNYLNHLTVHRTDNIIKVGAWKHKFVGSQDYDLNLRIWERINDEDIIHIPKILYHWRAIEGSTALDIGEKNYAVESGKNALQEHYDRTGTDATASIIPGIPFFRTEYNIPKPQPLVSLIIPTKDMVELCEACIASIYEKTTYENFEIILINNNSELPESFTYFEELEKSKRAKVLHYPHPFNYSAINNFAVEHSQGSIIGLVNNDIEFISEGWLTEMVSYAQNPEIGCVGAKLYFENDLIQHGGVIVGLGGVAGHAHKYFPREAPGYFYRAMVTQNFTAVTAACLMVRRDVFNEVNGLNEEDLVVAFNDVDFCLKVHSAGYRNVWTPFAEAYHYESLSRGEEDNPVKLARFNREIDYMKKNWKHILNNDPYYSPNLTRASENFAIIR